MCNSFLTTLLFFIWGGQFLFARQPDYRQIFGKDWDKAEEFVAENEVWMKQLSEKYNIPYYQAVAIIFPELIRYSALRDKMEITLLKSLYTNLGDEYADFSVGQFQMKPSFAEAIDKNISLLPKRLRSKFSIPTDFKSQWKYRASIVNQLEDVHSQFLYLAAFIKICENRFAIRQMSQEMKVKFLATAYNFSFLKSMDDINSMIDRKFFSTQIISRENYSYSDISLTWYLLHIVNNESSGNKN